MDIFSLGEFAAHLLEVEEEMHNAEEAIMEKACRIVEARAKSAIGTYEFGWPPLAPDTIAKKGSDTPLLETGELRESITHSVERENGEVVGYVGSDLDIAVYQELGTSKIPPRSFLREAAVRSFGEIQQEADKTVEDSLEGTGESLIDELSGAE